MNRALWSLWQINVISVLCAFSAIIILTSNASWGFTQRSWGGDPSGSTGPTNKVDTYQLPTLGLNIKPLVTGRSEPVAACRPARFACPSIPRAIHQPARPLQLMHASFGVQRSVSPVILAGRGAMPLS